MLCLIWIIRMITCCSQVTSQAPGKTLQDYPAGHISRVPKNSTTWKDCKCTACENSNTVWNFGQYENVAFNADVTSSSVSNSTYPVCAVTNGVKSFSSNIEPQCFHSNTNEQYPWVLVDLLGVFAFNKIKMYPWTDSNNRDLGLLMWIGMMVVVDDDTVVWYDKILREMGERGFDILFTGYLNARYIRFHKGEKGLKDQLYSFGFCFLEIWVCKIGTYGKFGKGCQPCPTNCNYPCNNVHGCKLSLHNVVLMKRGNQSHTTAVDPGYIVSGMTRDLPNRKCTIIDATNKDAWVWWNAYLGDHYVIQYVAIQGRLDCCVSDFLRNFYIAFTNSSSLSNFPPGRDETCAHHTGTTTTGLKRIDCLRPTIAQYVWILSQGKLGVCTFRAFGYAVYFLPSGSSCRSTSQYMFCTPFASCQNGVCICEPGRYGENCSMCSPGCQNTRCDKQNGNCDPCSEGYIGDTCSDCEPGRFGENCSMCSPGCQNRICDKQNGNCDPCSEGYIGDTCSECTLGYYKVNQTNRDTQLEYYKANVTNNDTRIEYHKATQTNNGMCQPCSEGCDDERLCDANGGRCNGCDGGLYGAFCELNCNARCKYCDQDDGMCTLCNDNLMTPNCTDCIGGYLKLPGVIACVRCLGTCRPGTVCNQSTGFCPFCPPGKEGDYCEIGQVSNTHKKVIVAAPVAAASTGGCVFFLYRFIGKMREMREKAEKGRQVIESARTATLTLKKMRTLKKNDSEEDEEDVADNEAGSSPPSSASNSRAES